MEIKIIKDIEKPKNEPIRIPRGDGPLVSFLLPTRGRPKMAAASIDSLYSLAADKSLIEFILKIDSDDLDTINLYNKLKTIIPNSIKAYISPRGKGYLEIYKWINHMCFMAKGDYLFMANDDAFMVTESYDQILLDMQLDSDSPWHGCTDILNLLCTTIDRPDATEFSFSTKKIVEILGHFSLNPHGDTWNMAVACGVSSTFRIPIYIKHENAKDDVRRDALEAYKISGRDINTCEAYRQKASDILKLVDHIEGWQKKNNCFREIVNR